jgi:hypothetical protein
MAPLPKLPQQQKGWHPSAVAYWRRIWSGPVASQWFDEDLGALHRLAVLVDVGYRREHRACELVAIARLESDLGLTPRARRVLGWRLGGGETVRRSRPPAAANVYRIRALDSALVEGGDV